MTMVFQLIMKLLTDKASLNAGAFTNNILSESAVLQAIPDFCSSLFLCLGMFMVVGLLWSGIGQKQSGRADIG
jgi:hypothetical protein